MFNSRQPKLLKALIGVFCKKSIFFKAYVILFTIAFWLTLYNLFDKIFMD